MNIHGLKRKRKNMILIERDTEHRLNKESNKKIKDEQQIAYLKKKLSRIQRAMQRATKQIRKLQIEHKRKK